MRRVLLEIYKSLFEHFGPQHWWPGESAFEIIIGAILTQNTNWNNVEKAVSNLKKANLLTPLKLYNLPISTLSELIRPAGYYNIKARRLKNFLHFLMEEYGGDLKRMLNQETFYLREQLLKIKGIGKETADSILLYAASKPIFVVDTYTYRILHRHNLVEEEASYDDLQALFMKHLDPDPVLFNEYHALLVRTGKIYCQKRPKCDNCPLKNLVEGTNDTQIYA